MSNESENKRIDLTQWKKEMEFVGACCEAALLNKDFLIAELKRCYYEIDLLQEYAKCVECGGQYIGPVDYGLHEWDHSKDCEYASE